MNKSRLATTTTLLKRLCALGLSLDEAKIYLELYQNPSTHLQLSRVTGVNRTKVYRVVHELEKRGLVARRTDDRGTFLVVPEITGLTLEIVQQEEKLKERRRVLQSLTSELNALKDIDLSFSVQTYEGAAGYKQMCWHELSTKGEILVLGNGTIEEEASDRYWSSRHRQHQIEAGYKTLEITNYNYGEDGVEMFTADKLVEAGLYEHRHIPPEIITFDGQTVVYNNTVGIYHWKHERKVGVELISSTYANMIRQIFYQYWQIATPSY